MEQNANGCLMYARVVTGLLRVVDPNIDVNRDSHLPSTLTESDEIYEPEI